MEQVEQQVEQLTLENKEVKQGEEQQQVKLTPNQLKKLKLKQKKAQLKEEQEKQTQEQKESQGENEQTTEAEPKAEEDTFKTELEWCIKQLKLGIIRNNLEKDQIQESQKVINKLESDKTPLIAKRHLMKVVFGDYRKLMKIIKN